MRIPIAIIPMVLMLAACGSPVVTPGLPGSPPRATRAPDPAALTAPASSYPARELAARLPAPPAPAPQAMARCVESDQRFVTPSDAATLNRKDASGTSASDVLVAWGLQHFGDRAYCYIPGDGAVFRKPDWRFLFTAWQAVTGGPSSGALTTAQVDRLALRVAEEVRVARPAQTDPRVRTVTDPAGSVRLEIPAGWTDWLVNRVLFVAPASGFPRFVVNPDPRQGGSLADFARAAPRAIEHFYKGLSVVRPLARYEAPLWTGLVMELAGETAGNSPVRERLLVFSIPCGARYVSLIARDLAADVERNRREILAIASAARCG